MITVTQRIKKYSGISVFIRYIFAIIVSFLILLPILVLLITSLKTNNEIMSNPLALPRNWLFENYITAWNDAKIGKYFFNSIFYCVSSVVITAFVSAAASFAFAKLKSKATNFLYPILLSGTMIPVISIIIPLYLMLAKIKLTNSYFGIIIVYVATSIPFAILITTASMKSIPNALIESATIDGCSLWGVFIKIFLPLSRTPLITISIITFIRLWNDFLIAMIMNSKSAYYTLGVGLKSFIGEHSIQYDTLSAGLILAIAPPIIIFILLQERIVEGLTAGSVKG